MDAREGVQPTTAGICSKCEAVLRYGTDQQLENDPALAVGLCCLLD